MSEWYTAEDFRAAKFAEHPGGGIAAKNGLFDVTLWNVLTSEGGMSVRNDQDMAEGGWIPVPAEVPKPTITRSELEYAREVFRDLPHPPSSLRVESFLGRAAGVTIVPDPEPTNTEKLAAILRAPGEAEWEVGPRGLVEVEGLARFLDENGVTAPGGDGDE